MKVTFGVHIREQGGQLRRHGEERNINTKVPRQIWTRRGELHQGAKSLQMGGLVLP
jgi:hypothetical protein